MKNRNNDGGFGPFDKQRKARTGFAFDVNPLPRPAPPKPKPKTESKPSFQEVMYPKANMPAQSRRAAPPPKPAKPKTESKLSFQESLYPRQKPVTQSAQPAGIVTRKRNRGNNVPALGEEAKAAFERERDAAKKAAEARGERFNDVAFFKTHGEPMIERAKAAQAIKDAGEERSGDRNKPSPKMNPYTDAGNAVGSGAIDSLANIPEGYAINQRRNALKLFYAMTIAENGEASYDSISDFPGVSLTGRDAAMLQKYLSGDAERWEALYRHTMRYALGDMSEIPAWRAGEDMKAWTKQIFPSDPAYADDVGHKVAEGFGSAATYVLAGLLTRRAGAGAVSGNVAMAAMDGMVSGFEDALAHGASFEDAYRAGKWNSYLGITDAIPLMRAFDRYDKATGGSISQLFTFAVKGAAEGSAQATLEQIRGNLIAARLVKYDPERDIWEGVEDAGIVGAYLGSAMNAATATSKSGEQSD